jgi:hypothetical protein
MGGSNEGGEVAVLRVESIRDGGDGGDDRIGHLWRCRRLAGVSAVLGEELMAGY